MRLAVCGFAALLLLAVPAQAEMSGGKIKIGVLTDLSGPYEQNSGVGSVEAAKMAAEEFGDTINGVPLEIVSADHQNKPDIGAAIVRAADQRRLGGLHRQGLCARYVGPLGL
jgi:branched-chain amino acid transport system substrate-binding protein